MSTKRNQCSNVLKRIRIYSRRRREEESSCDAQSGHETLIQAEVGGVIAPNYQDLFDMCKISVYVDELQ